MTPDPRIRYFRRLRRRASLYLALFPPHPLLQVKVRLRQAPAPAPASPAPPQPTHDFLRIY